MDQLHALIDYLARPELRGMPKHFPGQKSVIIPKAALPVFQASGLGFTEEPVAYPANEK